MENRKCLFCKKEISDMPARYVFCSKPCSAAGRQIQRKVLIHDRKAAGCCTECGNRLDREGTICSMCTQKQRKYYRGRIAKKQCLGCGKRLSSQTTKRRCSACIVTQRQRGRVCSQNIRREVLKAYGGRCVQCGEKRWEFLAIDHRANDGAAHRRILGLRGGTGMYYWIRRNNFPAELQILCHECNFTKFICDSHSRRSTNARVVQIRQCTTKLREEVINAYGGRCVCCGKTKLASLVIRHAIDKSIKQNYRGRNGSYNMFLWIKKHGFPKSFCVMCFNCHSSWSLYGYCPHQKERENSNEIRQANG